MSELFWPLIGIVAPIYLVMAAGFGMRKMGVLSGEADRSLSRLVVTLLIPCLAVDTILGNEALAAPTNWLLPPVFGYFSVVLGVLTARMVARIFRIPDEVRRRAFVFTVSIQNYGYIPLPLCQALFGRETVGVLFAFWMGVELAFWTVALWQLTGRPRAGGWWRALNPPIVVIPIALVMNALGAGEWFPGVLRQSAHILGTCAVPMGLLLSGALVADFANRGAIQHGARVSLAAVAVRIGLVPMALLAMARYLPIDDLLKAVLIVQAAMPAGIFPIAVTRLHQGSVPTALQVVLATSVVSLVTIPMWIGIGMWWVLGRGI